MATPDSRGQLSIFVPSRIGELDLINVSVTKAGSTVTTVTTDKEWRHGWKQFSVCASDTCWRSGFSCRLEAGTPDDLVQFLRGLGHLVQLHCNCVEIPRRRRTRAIQINGADHVLELLMAPKVLLPRSLPGRPCAVPVACV
jgi:hypothetical protein